MTQNKCFLKTILLFVLFISPANYANAENNTVTSDEIFKKALSFIDEEAQNCSSCQCAIISKKITKIIKDNEDNEESTKKNNKKDLIKKALLVQANLELLESILELEALKKKYDELSKQGQQIKNELQSKNKKYKHLLIKKFGNTIFSSYPKLESE